MSSGTVEADKSGDKPFSGVVVVFTAVHRKHVVCTMIEGVRIDGFLRGFCLWHAGEVLPRDHRARREGVGYDRRVELVPGRAKSGL